MSHSRDAILEMLNGEHALENLRHLIETEPAPAAEEKPKRRACRTKKAAEPAAEAEAPKKRAARTKKAAAAAEAAPAAEEKPARRTRAKKAEQ